MTDPRWAPSTPPSEPQAPEPAAPSTSEPPAPAPWTTTRWILLVAALYTAVSVAWSWPWAASDGSSLPTRQFDLFGVLWVVGHARDLLVDLRSSVTDLPLGEDVRRLDTWVLAAFAAVGSGWLSPVRLVQGLVLLGPVTGALAAERCAALGLGVRRPWSVVAGLVYAFSGLGATALLEGHVYYLFDPWLPLLAWALLAATGPGARARHGAAAAAMWSLALGTSAYTGIVATILVIALVARGAFERLDRAPLRRAALGFVAVALPVGLVYVALFAGGAGGVAADPATVLAGGSATLATLAATSPEVDLTNHSIAAPLGFVTVALVVAAPRVLRGRGGWRTLLGVAALSVVLALGPTVQAGMGAMGTWYWVDLQGASPVFGFLHFPVRLLWLWYLCAGLVAARVADTLAAHAGRAAWGLLPLVVADCFVTSFFPWRTGAILTAVPSAYAAAPPGRPVLDLLAEDPHPGSGLELWARGLTCIYQLGHHLPLPGRCLGPHGATPQEAGARALRAALLDGEDPLPALHGLDVGAVAVHLDLFGREDRVRVLAGLEAALGPAAGESADAGETIVLFRVLPVAPASFDR